MANKTSCEHHIGAGYLTVLNNRCFVLLENTAWFNSVLHSHGQFVSHQYLRQTLKKNIGHIQDTVWRC